MAAKVDVGESISFVAADVEIFRAVLDVKRCTKCGATSRGLLVVGTDLVWWICGECNAAVPKPAQLQLLQGGGRRMPYPD